MLLCVWDGVVSRWGGDQWRWLNSAAGRPRRGCGRLVAAGGGMQTPPLPALSPSSPPRGPSPALLGTRASTAAARPPVSARLPSVAVAVRGRRRVRKGGGRREFAQAVKGGGRARARRRSSLLFEGRGRAGAAFPSGGVGGRGGGSGIGYGHTSTARSRGPDSGAPGCGRALGGGMPTRAAAAVAVAHALGWRRCPSCRPPGSSFTDVGGDECAHCRCPVSPPSRG